MLSIRSVWTVQCKNWIDVNGTTWCVNTKKNCYTVQTRRYDGRKWCDHSDTQCASSIHVKAMGGNRARMPDDAPLPTPLPPTSISGDSSRKCTLPDATDSITERRWRGVMLVWIQAPRTQSGSSLTYATDKIIFCNNYYYYYNIYTYNYNNITTITTANITA